jgi:regulator of protease activity HflC (stomatin/prohibitin superfamily)
MDYRKVILNTLNFFYLTSFIKKKKSFLFFRMGRFSRILEPGLNFLIPFIDKVKYVQSLKEIAIDVPKQSAITLDNVLKRDSFEECAGN